eukprot:8232802-Pyramimonas_sp.AAC.1
MTYTWRCQVSAGGACRTPEGALLPQRMWGAEMEARVYCDPTETLIYTFGVNVSKGARSAVASTSLRMIPIPADAPPPPLVQIRSIVPA